MKSKYIFIFFTILILISCNAKKEEFSVTGDLTGVFAATEQENLQQRVVFYEGYRTDGYYSDSLISDFPDLSLSLQLNEPLIFSPLVCGDQICFFTAYKALIYNRINGELDGSISFDLPISSQPVVAAQNKDLVIITGSKILQTYHLEDLSLIFEKELNTPVYVSPAVDSQGSVYVAGTLITIYDTTGHAQRIIRNLPSVIIDIDVQGDIIYILTDKGDISSYSTLDGSLLWQVDAAGIPSGTLEFRNEKLIFAMTDDRLICLNKLSGKMDWVYQTGSPIIYPITLSSDIIYCVTQDNKIASVDLYDGHAVSTVRLPRPITTAPSVNSFGVFVSSEGACTLYRYDLREVLGNLFFDGSLQFPLLLADEDLFLTFSSGRVDGYSTREQNERLVLEVPQDRSLAENPLSLNKNGPEILPVFDDDEVRTYLLKNTEKEFIFYAETPGFRRFTAKTASQSALNITALNQAGHELAVNSEHSAVYDFVDVNCEEGKIYRFKVLPLYYEGDVNLTIQFGTEDF